jgi:hypothetical protein
MKELSENELLQLAQSETKKMDMHLWSQMVIIILIITQVIFVFAEIISVLTFFFMWLGLMFLYHIHRSKTKKAEIKMQEFLDELTNRGI